MWTEQLDKGVDMDKVHGHDSTDINRGRGPQPSNVSKNRYRTEASAETCGPQEVSSVLYVKLGLVRNA